MTRAFASVANKGVAVTPYAIRKVVTADGRLLYQHDTSEERVLVAPWVAAEMTDLLQSAVLTGHRASGPDRAPGRGQDGDHQLKQGRLVHRLFKRVDDRSLDGPGRCPNRSRAPGGHRSRPGVSRLHGRRSRQPAGRAIRDAGADARLAADSRGRDVRRHGRGRERNPADGRRERNADQSAADGARFSSAAPFAPTGRASRRSRSSTRPFLHRSHNSRRRVHRSLRPASAASRAQFPRPSRRSRGPTSRRTAFAWATPGPNNRASKALNSAP